MHTLAIRLGVLLLLLIGCRHTPPELKPQKGPEVLNVPPEGDNRYDNPAYPKEAFNNGNNNNKTIDSAGGKKGSPMMPGQPGSFNPSGTMGRGY